MKKFIYKITNLVNNKIYIGQTKNDPKDRFRRHCLNYGSRGGESHKNESVINNSILKYGKENFLFEVIEGPVENYNEREKYWIKYYNCKTPNGYNLTDGGEEPPILYGENNNNASHSQEQINEIKYLLKNSDLSMVEISKKFHYKTSSTISAINIGRNWFDPNEEYPLRKLKNQKIVSSDIINSIIFELLNSKSSQKDIAKKYNVGRHIVTAINTGENHRKENLSYPLRIGRHYN